MPKMTIKEIARLAGVSTSAVSIVLNNRPGVSENTRKKVQEIIRQNNYVPNPNSRRLLLDRSDNITVLLAKDRRDLSNQFYVELNNEIVPECDKAGCNLVYAFYEVTSDGKVIFPRIIEHRDTGGIIFLGSPPIQVQQKIISYEIPFVISDTHEPQPDIPSVYTDYCRASYSATSYLIQNGHREIGYLGYESPKYMQKTLEGFQFALRDGGCLYHPEWVLTSPNSDKISFERSSYWESTGKIPSAIFCTSDFIAIGCLQYFQKNGLNVPADISLISIDDILLASYVTPRLTTVRIDKPGIARASIALLLDRISKRCKLPENISVPVGEIIERDSVRSLVSRPEREARSL